MTRSKRFLTDPQIATLNNVLIAAGQITAGSIAAPLLFPSVEKPPTGVLLLGMVGTLVFWLMPIILSRRIKYL